MPRRGVGYEQQRKILADRLHHLVGDLVHLGTVVGDVVCGGGGMSKEVLKLALDHSEPSILSPGWTLVRNEDIAALREALAQDVPETNFGNTALDKMAENARELGLDYEPAQQEYERGFIDGMQEQMRRSVDRAVNAMAQRTWVGLTDEDIEIAFDDTQEGGGFDDFARAIEAKLKEKNT